jgi:hypothetical protein
LAAGCYVHVADPQFVQPENLSVLGHSMMTSLGLFASPQMHETHYTEQLFSCTTSPATVHNLYRSRCTTRPIFMHILARHTHSVSDLLRRIHTVLHACSFTAFSIMTSRFGSSGICRFCWRILLRSAALLSAGWLPWLLLMRIECIPPSAGVTRELCETKIGCYLRVAMNRSNSYPILVDWL